MSQRNQDRKKLETNAPTELWCPCWQICHPLALHTLYPPHVSPAFRLARTHFILKKKDRSISYSVKKQTKKQFRGITHVILFILCSIFNTSSTTSISHPVATAQPYHNPVQKLWDKSFLGVQYSKKLGWGWNALTKAFFVFKQFTGIVSRLAGLWKDIQSWWMVATLCSILDHTASVILKSEIWRGQSIAGGLSLSFSFHVCFYCIGKISGIIFMLKNKPLANQVLSRRY